MNAIEYRRGKLHIRNREVLEQAVCECYAILQVQVKNPQTPAYPAFSL